MEVHKKIIQLVQEVMSETKYFIKIGNTITDQFYSNTSDHKLFSDQKLFGAGQGSGFSPQIWTLFSNELFQIYSEYSVGFEFNSPYSTSSSQLHITAYVDDVNTHRTFCHNTDIQTMIKKPQSPLNDGMISCIFQGTVIKHKMQHLCSYLGVCFHQ
jgi:hypothetical protein